MRICATATRIIQTSITATGTENCLEKQHPVTVGQGAGDGFLVLTGWENLLNL